MWFRGPINQKHSDSSIAEGGGNGKKFEGSCKVQTASDRNAQESPAQREI